MAERLRNCLQYLRPSGPHAASNSTPVRIRTLASSVAAIAAGKLLNPFRTQKISPSTFHTVLRCASPREIWIAAAFDKLFLQTILPGISRNNGVGGHVPLLQFYYFSHGLFSGPTQSHQGGSPLSAPPEGSRTPAASEPEPSTWPGRRGLSSGRRWRRRRPPPG